MSTEATGMTHLGDDQATPVRLRKLPSRLLSVAAAQADRLVSTGLAGVDARKWHYAVLVALQESGPASQSTLSRRTGIYRSDLVAVINELADRGMVQRAPDPADRRRNVITMTPQGRDHLSRLDTLLASFQDDLLAPLTEPEREQLIGFLERLVGHHARATPRPAADR
ncbi:MarR family winged helix-turn-helix transcriptional regulator [Streptosporangium sp. CA-135522]|uniref:MarR family winged helix-turn-helix transcriptional regulator n=1 Tax=Streptosporangium sp. CA-135522 TaxID=3240072 RepID=UPI003D91AD40